jgi:hypothetical protein
MSTLEPNYLIERLTNKERELMKTPWSLLSRGEKIQRELILLDELERSLSWGFFQDGLIARIKRAIYKNIAHQFYKRSTSHLVPTGE